ncbi:alpha amylase C-terminal domain-containing protein [Paracidobacterium acidisoli]|uniref:1,4-alpha-glucan branching enzyme n=1 Tax=Paracidobacterium acidisoli TaxID=2303751 RepID=A0A372IUC0_9BACT|nr:alpha amylase C-terminal domain-containing protein [Paracidobacterium acidisoli]MBT9329826.1 alpha amylase C-terminal domain-containing protein [Paracidobacterium acidisoli]
MMSQAHITPETPMGANLVEGGGATFRVWAPRATAVYLNGTFAGVARAGETDDLLMVKDANGYWTGFLAEAQNGDLYNFQVVGAGSSGLKRDPYARAMGTDQLFPDCSCVIRPASAYPWHDAQFVTPDFSDMIVYQLHIGTYAIVKPGVASTFLDVIGKIEYMVSLGVNVLQPLPIDEIENGPSMGYNGGDYFSPDFPYVVYDPAALAEYLPMVNNLLAAKGCEPLQLDDLSSGPAQLKALVDLCHVYGIAVVFDVVYNHAGGFFGDDHALYFWDRAVDNGDNNQSLYFTDQGLAGGLSFALWNDDVRQFVINNARFCLEELHGDGFRYDEISELLVMNGSSGWSFCQDLTGTVRFVKPKALQNAEYWPSEYTASSPQIVTAVASDGTGFDTLQHDGLRSALRGAVQQASTGADAAIDLDSVARALYPAGFAHAWQTVPCVENHDLVAEARDPRMPVLADSSNPESWYARSRSRWATAVLLASPGIPQLFMGQEFLESKQWSCDPESSNLISWAWLTPGADTVRADHFRFTQDAIRLRHSQPALRTDNVNAFHVHDQNRVIAFHRWIEGAGRDVIVVASLAETTWYGYQIGFPFAGSWLEVFNSDVYDNWVNPVVAGNGGAIVASGAPLHGFSASAAIVIPANGVVVFARDAGD